MTLFANYQLGNFVVPVSDSSEYGEKSIETPDLSFQIPTVAMVDAVNKWSIFASDDDTPHYAGRTYRCHKRRVSFVATNGFIMSLYRNRTIPIDLENKEELHAQSSLCRPSASSLAWWRWRQVASTE